MHSIRHALVVAVVLLALVGRQSLAGSSFKKDDARNKELDQKYNKIFSGRGLFALDPETTRQWLKELNQQLDYDVGQEEKYDKVRKLLAFDKIDPNCDLTNGSGNELLAYYKQFTDPISTTSTIKSYITNCLARMYEKCKESFVVSTEKAVGRLSSNESFDYEQMVRLKELVADESDLRTPVAQFLLERMDTHRLPQYEFEGHFESHISEPCKTVREQLDFMMYFDVLLTLKQIESMGESVRQWYKVRSVCKWVLLDARRTKDGVFARMKSVFGQEDSTIDKRYRQLFKKEAQATWTSWKPEKTYERLVWLEEKLQKHSKGSGTAQIRLNKVRTLLELGRFWQQTHQCDMDAAIKLNQHLAEKDEKHTLTVKKYLLHLRDQAFELCRKEMAEQVAGSVQRLAQDSLWKKIFRLKDLIVKNLELAAAAAGGRGGDILLKLKFSDLVLGFMDEQAGTPLSPEMDRAEFDKQLNAVVYEPCKLVSIEFKYFQDVRNIWRLEVANQMEPTVRDWFLTYETCSNQYKLVREATVYAQLLARGRRDWSRGWL